MKKAIMLTTLFHSILNGNYELTQKLTYNLNQERLIEQNNLPVEIVLANNNLAHPNNDQNNFFTQSRIKRIAAASIVGYTISQSCNLNLNYLLTIISPIFYTIVSLDQWLEKTNSSYNEYGYDTRHVIIQPDRRMQGRYD